MPAAVRCRLVDAVGSGQLNEERLVPLFFGRSSRHGIISADADRDTNTHNASRSITRRRGSETGHPDQGGHGLASQAVLRLTPADSAAFSTLRVLTSAPKNGSRQPLESGLDTGNSPRVVIQICTMPRVRSRGGGGRKQGVPAGRPRSCSQAVLRLMPADSAAFSTLRVFASAPKNGSRRPLEGGFDTANSPRVVIQICIVLARAREAAAVGSSRKQGFRATGAAVFPARPCRV